MKKLYSVLFCALFSAFCHSVFAQTQTDTIYCTGTTGSYKSGSVNSAGTKNDDNLITINSSSNRGWAIFDLSGIPAGSTIASATVVFTTYSSVSSSATNSIYGFVDDPSTASGTALYAECASGTVFVSSAWAANATLSKVINSTGVTFLNNNIGNSIGLGFVRGSTNTYNIYGYSSAQRPVLIITYSAPTNTVPSFTNGATAALAVCQGDAAVDIRNIMHVSDTNAGQTLTWSQGSAPSNGTLVFNSATASAGSDVITSGNITYQPAANYSGSDSFTVIVNDGNGGSDTITVDVTVNGLPTISLNSNPGVPNGSTVANLGYSGTTNSPDIYSIAWDAGAATAGFGDVSFTTLPSSPIAITVPSNPGSGTYTGTLMVKNSATGCVSQGYAMGVDVSATNNAPQFLIVDRYSYPVCKNVGTSLMGILVVTDTDASQSLTWSLLVPPLHGTLDLTGPATPAGIAVYPSGGAPYYPETDYTGTDSFVVQVSDGNGGFDTLYGLVTIYERPTITLDTIASVPVGTSVVYLPYTDTAYSAVEYSYGWNSLLDTAGFTNQSYTPLTASPIPIPIPSTANPGTYSAEFYVFNDATSCASIAHSISVTIFDTPNVAPYFVEGDTASISLCQGSSFFFETSMTVTDTNKNQVLTWSALTQPLHGTIAVTGTGASGVDVIPAGSFSYQPDTSFSGQDYFTVQVADDYGGADTIGIYVTVNPRVSLSVTNTSVISGSASAYLNYVATTSPDAYTLAWSIQARNAGFANIINASPLPASPYPITVPANVAPGTYTGSFKVANSITHCSSPTRLFTLTAIANTPPSFVNGDTVSLSVCGTSLVDISSLLHVSDTNAGQTLTWSVLSQPSVDGTLTITGATATAQGTDNAPSGTLTYQAATGYTSEFFMVQVSDGINSDTIKVNVTIGTLNTSVGSQANISCNGANDGSASVSVTSGVTPYTYSWSPAGGTSSSASGLSAGTYTVTVNDAASCSGTQTVTITEPAVLSASISGSTNVSCNGGNNGSATVLATGGTTAYGYSWSPSGGTGATASGLTAGSYTVTVTDANNCQQTASVTLTEPSLVTAAISGTTTICNNTATTITITSDPGVTVGYSVNGGTTQTVTTDGSGMATVNTGALTAATTYSLVNVMSGACTYTSSGSATASVYPVPDVNMVTDQSLCSNNMTDAISFGGSVPGTTYSWSNSNSGIGLATSGNGDIASFTAINNGATVQVATVTVTPAANGCAGTPATFTITAKPTPVFTSLLTAPAICSDATFNYTPVSSVPATTFTWSRDVVTGISNTPASGTDDPAEVLTSTATDPVTVTYIYTLSVNGCTNTQNVDVTVNPPMLLSSAANAGFICNTTQFDYIPASTTTGVTFTWSRALTAGISNTAASGPGDPAETLVNTTTDPVTVTYVYTLSANGCSNTQDVTVDVYPAPMLSSTVTPAAVCDSSLFDYTPSSATTGVTYSWSRAMFSGISNVAASGTGNPMEYLVNTIPLPVTVTYVYTLSVNGCTNIQNVDVVVNPEPVLNTTLTPAAICDSTLFSYPASSLTPGTSFAWTRAAVTGIANAASNSTGDPGEYLDNTTTDPVTVIYNYTLTAFGCSNSQDVTVTVNPTPVLTGTLVTSPICDSTLFSYVPTSATAGTTFTWMRDTMPGITNSPAMGTGDPAEYLVNVTQYPINLNYVYTLTANGCSNVQNVNMTVNPRPLLSSAPAAAPVCDSAQMSYLPESLTAGTSFAWSRATVAGIANAAATGIDDPAEILYNTTADPVTVTYVYTLTAYGCSNTQDMTIVVNPTPKLSSTLSPAAICNNTMFNYLPASATAGASFAWSRAHVSGINNAAASGTGNPGEILLNTSANLLDVTYVYTITANGCNFVQDVVLPVNATPLLSGSTVASVCSGTPFHYTAGSTTTGTTFAWTRAAVAGIGNAAGSGSGDINEALINTTSSARPVVYHFTLTVNGCTNVQNVLVTVSPAPPMPSIATMPPANLCQGTMYQNFGAATDAPDSVNYTWSAVNASVYAVGAGQRYSVVSFPEAGNAYVVLTANTAGYTCYASDTFRVAVSSAASTGAEIFYVHDHFFYTDNTVESFQWGYDDAATLDSVIYTGQVDQNLFDATPDFAGKYYWVITTKGGCMAKTYYNRPTGISEVGNAEMAELKVFPNPASDNVAVEIKGISGGNSTVTLADITGKLIATTAVTDNKAVLTVGNLASGVYVVTCYHNGIMVGTAKIVRE